MAELNNWGANLEGTEIADTIIYNGTRYVRSELSKIDHLVYDMETMGYAVISGTGASAGTQVQVNFLSVLQLVTGTTTTGYAGRTVAKISIPDAAKLILDINIRTDFSSLSDATNEYEYYYGVWLGTFNVPTDGFYIKYQRTSNVNWLCSTISSSTETTTDSGIAVTTNTFFNFKIIYDSTTPDVKFYIDNALVATNTTNMPTGSGFFTRVMSKKTAGTTSRTCLVTGMRQTIIRD